MKNIKLLFILALSLAIFSSCDDDESDYGTKHLNYVTFENDSYNFEVTPDGNSTKDVYIYSTQVTNSDRTFNLNLLADESTADPSTYTVPTSVTIPAGSNTGTISVSATDVDFDLVNAKTIVLELVSADSSILTGENITIYFLEECLYNKVFLNIEFDSYPEEVYWVIKDADGNTIAESATPAAFGAYAGLSGSIAQTFCIEDGNYTFTIYDGYSDGAGPVSLSTSDGTVLFSSDGAYGAGTMGAFTL